MLFAEVILPLPLQTTFTYSIPDELSGKVKQGYRVIVPFGRKRYYTAIVWSTTTVAPENYEVKPITMVLDETPIIKRPQLQFWEWIAEYYLCAVGDVFKAAVPSGLKIESETFVDLHPDFEEDSDNRLSEREIIILQCLEHSGKNMTLGEIEKRTGFSNIGALITKMLEKEAIIVAEKLVERYRTRKETYVRPAWELSDTSALHKAFATVGQAKKQESALLTLLSLCGRNTPPREVSRDELRQKAEVSTAIISAMAKKGVIEIYTKEIKRFGYDGSETVSPPALSERQDEALKKIHKLWQDHDINLLHGVTSSGKTEIYIHLIDFVMKQGRQALYLVPEIALTTQLTTRLQKVFGDKVIIYHSKFSDNERVDIWKSMLQSSSPCVVIGARSSVFLPYSNLGLVIVDEEHESSYKQQDPAPRYNARDAAMVLARMHGAKTLLGSATPSVDTYFKAVSGRYGLVSLHERYSGIELPVMQLVDTNLARQKGELKGAFTSQLTNSVKEAIASGHQAIIFLNRRGFAPVAVCRMCGWVPKCDNCDVSLTYHKHIDKLVCHYCGTPYLMPAICPVCKEPSIEVAGYGTERIEDDIESLFPDIPVSRMDLDTTRNKDGYENLISAFSHGKSRILVGTQMVSKGLDFNGVSTVGVVNADALVSQPDFRSAERAFNMIEQVAGRAGRRGERGKVIIQTRCPDHPIYSYVMAHDYQGFYETEISERRRYNYPPFTRLIYIYIKHRDRLAAEELSTDYSRRLRELFGNRVFGPEEPTVGRIQSLFIRKIMLKIETAASMKKVREILRHTYEEIHKTGPASVKGMILYYDVDPY